MFVATATMLFKQVTQKRSVAKLCARGSFLHAVLGLSDSRALGFSTSCILGFSNCQALQLLAQILGFSTSRFLAFSGARSWVLALSNSRIFGFSDSWSPGSLILGFLDSRVIGFSSSRILGFLDSRVIGFSVSIARRALRNL